MTGEIVVYRGPRPAHTVRGVAFQRDVPTWVRYPERLADDRELDDWVDGDPAVTGPAVGITVPRDPMFLLGIPSLVAAMRRRYPTCPVEIAGQPLYAAFADAGTVVAAGNGSSGVYRRENLTGDRKAVMLRPGTLRIHSLARQMLRAVGFDDEPVMTVPGAKAGYVVVLQPRRGSWRELPGILSGQDVQSIPSYADDLESAAIVRDASLVISEGVCPLVWVACLAGVPVRVLTATPLNPVVDAQLSLCGAEVAVADLADARQADPHRVRTTLVGTMGASRGIRDDSGTGRPESAPGIGGDARGRRGRRFQPADETPEPDPVGDTPDPDPVS